MKLSRRQLTLEGLESRTLPSTCVVNNLQDFGLGKVALVPFPGPPSGDLRYCMNWANAQLGEDLIIFGVEGTINLKKVLPDITDDLIIAGPGADQLTVNAQKKGRVLAVDSGITAQVY